VLLDAGPLGIEGISAATGAPSDRLETILERLRNEGFIAKDGPIYRISDKSRTEHLK
jgi:predicted transcriptional regulator